MELWGLGLLFFTTNMEALSLIVASVQAILTISALIAVYSAHYIFAPHRPPWLALSFVLLLGLVTTVASFIQRPRPSITAQNGVDLGMSFNISLLTFLLLSLGIGTTAYIFIRLFSSATGRAKALALIIATTAVFAVIQAFVRLIILYGTNPSARTIFYDFSLALIGLVFIVFLTLGPFLRKFFLNFLGPSR